jgi:hypothetical protein
MVKNSKSIATIVEALAIMLTPLLQTAIRGGLHGNLGVTRFIGFVLYIPTVR